MHRSLAPLQFLFNKKGKGDMNNVVLESKNITLVETLDRVLNKGVVLNGDITISVADVDLIFVGLKVLLASVETAEKMHWGYKRCEYDRENGRKDKEENEKYSFPIPQGEGARGRGKEAFSSEITNELEEINAVLPKIDAHPDRVEQGLGRLVLTLVELIRKLIEKQAMRRIDGGSLSDEEIERLGDTFMRLEKKMEELKKVFGLKDEDLNLNLGPLGDLM